MSLSLMPTEEAATKWSRAGSQPPPQSNANQPGTGDVKRREVLLVDRDPSVAEVVALALRHTQFDFRVATNFNEAVHFVAQRAENLGLVITDVEPRGEGLALLAAIRTTHENLAVVVLTSMTDQGRTFEAKRLGASKVLSKPIDFLELTAVMDGFAERSLCVEPLLPSLGNRLRLVPGLRL